MKCPDEIAEILLEILTLGCLSIRYAANQGDSAYCFIEANHIHNLPAILSNYKPEKLDYYWNVERVSYLEKMQSLPAGNSDAYSKVWSRLKTHIKSL